MASLSKCCLVFVVQELCLHTKLLASPNTSIADFLSKAAEPPPFLVLRNAVALLKVCTDNQGFVCIKLRYGKVFKILHQLTGTPEVEKVGRATALQLFFSWIDFLGFQMTWISNIMAEQ